MFGGPRAPFLKTSLTRLIEVMRSESTTLATTLEHQIEVLAFPPNVEKVSDETLAKVLMSKGMS
jgi:hypothetical protein